MTVQTQFHNWQSSPRTPDPRTCAPICRTWSSYLRGRWGGQDLGCYVSRPVVGGSSPSSHASGAATDWRYHNPGPGRDRMLREVMPWLLNNSRALGLQAVHDYAGRRIWRPPGTSGRPTSPSPECGWRPNSGSQMHPANTWLHLECLNTRWDDTRTVDQMLTTTPPPNPGPGPGPIPSDQEIRDMSTFSILAKASSTGGDITGVGSFWAGNGLVRIWVNGGDFARNLVVPPDAVDARTGRLVNSWDQVGSISAADINRLLGRRVQ